MPRQSLPGKPSPASARGSGVGGSKPRGRERGQRAGPERSPGPGAPRGLQAHAPHLGEAGCAGAQRWGRRRELQPRARQSWTVPGPRRAELPPAPPPPPPPRLQQIAGERLRGAPAQPRRDRRSRRSASNSFPAGGATAPTRQRPARRGKLRAPSPARRPRDPRRLPAPARPSPLGEPTPGRATRGNGREPPPTGVCTLSGGPTCRGGRLAAACPDCGVRLL